MSTISLTFEFSSTPATTATATSVFDQPFPSSLTLTPLHQVDQLITDVPYFCVGVMAFALLVFCLSTKRWSKPFAYIIASAVVAFIGSVIDLAAIINSSTSNLFALLVAREMSYAASIGLRFIFFWTYAGRRPQFEAVNILNADVSSTPSTRTHSASWNRWGIPGIILQYTAYLGCFMILTLQTIWRFGALFKLSRFTAEYHADSIVELAIGGLLILKFLSTAYYSSRSGRLIWRTIGPAIVALWIQKGVAIGNIIVMRFSESALGRLLQALVMLITMTSLLISAFLDAPVVAPNASARPNRTSSFQGLALRNSFRTFRATMAGMPATSSEEPNPPGADPTQPRPSPPRRSTTERFSQWVSSRVSGSRIKDDRIHLFAQADPEKEAGLTGTMTEDMYRSPVDFRQPDMVYDVPKPLLLQRATMQTHSGEENASILAAYTSSRSTKDVESVKQRPPSPAVSKRSSYSMDGETGYSIAADFPVPPPLPIGQRVESPVYGLDGIIKKTSAREVSVPPPKQGNGANRKSMAATVEQGPRPETGSSSESSGIQTLARRQEELEQSVRAFRTLAPSSATTSQGVSRNVSTSRRAADPSGSQLTPGDGQTANRLTGTTGPTSSATSDFSLSNFPSPPAALKSFLVDTESVKSVPLTEKEWDDSMSFKPRETAPLQVRRASSVRVVDKVPFDLVPPKMPAAMAESHQRVPSVPSTTRGSDYSALFGEGPGSATVKGRFAGVVGQRIDVTSFIGGLSRHDGPPSASVTHSRQASDKSDKTGRTVRPMPSVIPEEGSTRFSEAGSSSVVMPVQATLVKLPPSSALVSTALTSPDDDAISMESFSTSIAESPVRPMPPQPAVLRPKAALPFSPRPARGTTSPTAEVVGPKPFERPRPPPLRFGGDGQS